MATRFKWLLAGAVALGCASPPLPVTPPSPPTAPAPAANAAPTNASAPVAPPVSPPSLPLRAVPRLAVALTRAVPVALATLSIPRETNSPTSAPPPRAPHVEPSPAPLQIAAPAAVTEALSTESVAVAVTIHGRLAHTELTQVFRNHTDRQTEGTYALRLPAGAALSRLAMDVDGAMVEGELVEREKARRIYESIVHQQKDPALLEWQGGNRFSTHVFPIPAGGTKTVVVGWDELLPIDGGEVRYRYALPGEGQGQNVGRFQFALDSDVEPTGVQGYGARVEASGGGFRVAAARDRFAPEGPLEVTFGAATLPKIRVGSRVDPKTRASEAFFLVDHVFPGLSTAPQPPKTLVVALDTSAGIGSVELARTIALVRSLARTLPDGTTLRVVHGSLPPVVCDPGLACLDHLEPVGATDLGALVAAATTLAVASPGAAAVVLASDGVASMGELDFDLLRSRLGRSIASADVAFHTLAIGPAPSEDELASFARIGRGHALVMTPEDDAPATAERVAAAIAEPVVTDVKVEVVSGEVDGLVPSGPASVSRGEVLPILGRLATPSATLRVTGRLGASPVSATWTIERGTPSDDALLTRLWARSAIAEMERGHVDRANVVATSLSYGVLTRYTSLLVLENEQAYERWQIQRQKQAEQDAVVATPKAGLTKGTGSLQDKLAEKVPATAVDAKREETKEEVVYHDAAAQMLPVPKPAAASSADKRSVGRVQLGALDLGAGGNATKDGDDSPKSPRARLIVGEPEIGSGLAANDVRRVIRSRGNLIRYCYERRLTVNPNLAGKVTMTFSIRGDGTVTDVRGTTTMGDQAVFDCVRAAVMRMVFPKPEGNAVIRVTYPFVFRSTEESAADARLERIEALAEPTSQEILELFELYAQLDRPELARKRWARLATETGRSPLELCRFGLEARAQLPGEADRIDGLCVKAILGGADPALISGAATVFAERQRVDRFTEAFGQALPEAADAAYLLTAALTVSPDAAYGMRLFETWSAQREWTPAERFNVLRGSSRAWQAIPEVVFAAGRTLLAAGPNLDALDALVGGPWPTDRSTELLALIDEQCRGADADVPGCQRLVARLTATPAVQALAASLASRELDWVRRQRREDMGNAELIARHAALLRARGDSARADLVQSELVEFAPTDFGVRSAYAQVLEGQDRHADACAQLALAVQLEPAQRDTFRTMMALRRRHDDQAKAVRACIVDGVSKLPVQRAISLVLTWDDPTADVDLHVVDPAGEEVYYSHRESVAGGFLYYDITDGFGPEIYTLGTAPKGHYRLSLVYYRGDARSVSGTLTVLRNAGAPDETREDHPFVLRSANPDRQQAIVTLEL